MDSGLPVIMPTGLNVCKMLNMALHQILYMNKVYPRSLFAAQERYDINIWKCKNPDVVTHIQTYLNFARALLDDSNPLRIIFRLKDVDTVIEEYVFHILIKENHISSYEIDFAIEILLKGLTDAMNVPDRVTQSQNDDYSYEIELETRPLSFIPDGSDMMSGWWTIPKDFAADAVRIMTLQTIDCSAFVLHVDLCER